jgi:hypothetical protein
MLIVHCLALGLRFFLIRSSQTIQIASRSTSIYPEAWQTEDSPLSVPGIADRAFQPSTAGVLFVALTGFLFTQHNGSP